MLTTLEPRLDTLIAKFTEEHSEAPVKIVVAQGTPREKQIEKLLTKMATPGDYKGLAITIVDPSAAPFNLTEVAGSIIFRDTPMVYAASADLSKLVGMD